MIARLLFWGICLLAAALLLVLVAGRSEAVEFGCFVDVYRCGGIEAWPAVVKEMRSVGMTTGVISARTTADLTFEIDTMIEAGMVPEGLPMLIISETQERREPLYSLGGWAPGEIEGAAAMLQEAPLKSPYRDRWPELIPYGPDEPGRGEPGADVSGAGELAAIWRALGLKSGTAVEGANVMDCIPFFDVIAICAQDGYNTGEQIAELRRLGKHFWIYDSGLSRDCSHNLALRMGRWCCTNPEVYLFWSWQTLNEYPAPWRNAWLAAYKAFVEGIPR